MIRCVFDRFWHHEAVCVCVRVLSTYTLYFNMACSNAKTLVCRSPCLWLLVLWRPSCGHSWRLDSRAMFSQTIEAISISSVLQSVELQDIASLFGQLHADGKMLPGQVTIDKDLLLLPISSNFTRPKQSKTFWDLMTPQLFWFCEVALHIMMWFTNINYPMRQPPVCSSLLQHLQ